MQEKNSGIGEKERIVEIEVERLREFRGHPFKVKPDDQMIVGRILRTFKIKKNVEVTDNGKIII